MVIISFVTDTTFLSYVISLLQIIEEKYPYSALKFEDHHLVLELPGKDRTTWTEEDEEFFDSLAEEGWIQQRTRRFYHTMRDDMVDMMSPQENRRSLIMVFFTLPLPSERFPSFVECIYFM